MNRLSRIYVAGGDTQLGQALRECLNAAGYRNLVGEPPDEPALTRADEVETFFQEHRPQYVFLVAGASAGIAENQRRPADLMLHNLLVSSHVLDQSRRHGVTKLLYLASSCAYPKDAPQPLHVESLLTGPLERTSQAYATAKLAGWKLSEAFRQQYGAPFVTAFPANPFGPFDDFDCQSAHVIPALLRRMHEAKVESRDTLPIWGSGTARREFIYIRDLADACLFVMRHYDGAAPLNLGSGVEYSIAQIARLIADVVGFRGRLKFDADRPTGMARKALDSSPLHDLGWRVATPFRTALEETYAWYLAQPTTEDALHARASV